MKKQRFYSYRTKLILSYLLLMCLPLMILGGYSFMTSKRTLDEQIMREHKTRIADMKYQLNLQLQEYIELGDILKYDDNILRILENDYRDIINLRRDLIGYLDPLFQRTLLLKSGLKDLSIYTTSDVPQYGYYLNHLEKMSQLEWLNNNIEEGWYVQDNNVYYVQQFYNYMALKDDNYLVMTIDKKNLLDTVIGMKNNLLLIVDKQFNAIYESSNLINKDIQVEPITGKVKDARFTVLQEEIKLAGWQLLEIVPNKVNRVQLLSIIKITIIIIIGCLVVLFILAIYLTNTLFRPIRDLSKVMKKVGEGDLKVQIKSRTHDEIGYMTLEFNHMIAKINELIEQVYKANLIKKEAQLKALQAQINPHFLYNTLSMINWKAILNSQKEISQCVTLLSKFYETALNKGKNIISVYDEIDNMKAYLDIQLIMHGYNLTIDYAIDEKVYEYYTLNLILQPFVENAIEHGLRKLDRLEEGRLLFKACIENETMKFIIEDNGIGIEPETFKHIYEKQSEHYGIKNVQERIQLQFGENYGIQLVNKVEEKSRGVRVILTLPLYKNIQKEV